MDVMLAYDHSRNSRIAISIVKSMFAKEMPEITLISVIEEPGSTSDSGDELFRQQYNEQKAGTEMAAAELAEAGFKTKILVAHGDARKMILRAVEERRPDMLVIVRHSHKPDGNIISRSLDALVDEFLK